MPLPRSAQLEHHDLEFPITINGNVIENNHGAALDAPPDSYIIIQTQRRIDHDQKGYLKRRHINVLEHIPKHTLLCTKSDVSLSSIRLFHFVAHVDVYRPIWKICRAVVRRKAHVGPRDLQICSDKIRLVLRNEFLKEVSEIEAVRSIEVTLEVPHRNDWVKVPPVPCQPPTGSCGLQPRPTPSRCVAPTADTWFNMQPSLLVGQSRPIIPGAI